MARKKSPKSTSKVSRDQKALLELQARLKGLDVDGLLSMLSAIHNSQIDDADKLRKKDLALINYITDLNKQVGRGKPWMQQGLYDIFVTIIKALYTIEAVLWE